MLQAFTVNAGPAGPDVTLPAAATPSETQLVVDALNAHNQRIFKVTIISTVIIGMSAAIATLRTIRQLRRDEALFSEHIQRLHKRKGA